MLRAEDLPNSPREKKQLEDSYLLSYSLMTNTPRQQQHKYSQTSRKQTPSGPEKASVYERCPLMGG